MTTRHENWLSELDPYRITYHGDNPWTDLALTNVLCLRRHFDDVRDFIDGQFTSVYRCVRINTKVGGSPTSRHLRALACDIAPGEQFSPPIAARLIFDNAKDGKFGMIRAIIIEPTWVHVSWWSIAEEDRGMYLYRKKVRGYQLLAQHVERDDD